MARQVYERPDEGSGMHEQQTPTATGRPARCGAAGAGLAGAGRGSAGARDAHGIDEAFLAEVNKQAAARKPLSKDHFSLDGTLLEACASIKSFKPKDAVGERDFRGEKFSNKTHRSTTDPDARLCRKGDGGQAAKLCHMGHALIGNRSGLVVAASVSEANGTAEGTEGLKLLDSLPKGGRRRNGSSASPPRFTTSPS